VAVFDTHTVPVSSVIVLGESRSYEVIVQMNER